MTSSQMNLDYHLLYQYVSHVVTGKRNGDFILIHLSHFVFIVLFYVMVSLFI